MMRTRCWPLALVFALSTGAAVVAMPQEAHACGGCFAPPVDNTVVSYHRMILSISTKETTLYDQIQYSGNPSSFAWVLPIRGEAKVGISADLVFQIIDQNTKTQWAAPPMNCPAAPYCPSRNEYGAASADSMSADAGVSSKNAGSVEVLKEETVGPYETVQLKSTNPTALTDWLTSRGYNVPTDIQPLIATYVSEGFDFLALKLVPGTGIQSMKPVRVTTQGAAPSLPLRMVAAGSGAQVGITLWVAGEGRWEPQSFPSFAIAASDVTWRWANYSNDSDAKRKAKIAELGQSAWEIENSIEFGSFLVSNTISAYTSGPMPPRVQLPDGGFGTLQVYDPVLDDQGNVIKTSAEVEAEDMDALFQKNASVRLTRMHSDLPRASLATDLTLQASKDQALLPTLRQITKEADEPQCPVYEGCKYVGTKPRSEAKNVAASSCGDAKGDKFCGGTVGGGCSVQTPRSASDLGPWALAAFGVILAGARGVRTRRLSKARQNDEHR